MPKNTKTNPADDIRAGANLARIRLLRHMSQTALGDAIGVTFQQVQKYEKGKNRISVSMLLAICRTLGCSVTDIVGDIDADTEALLLPAYSRAALRMADAFDRIPDERQRHHLLHLVETMGQPQTVVELVGDPLARDMTAIIEQMVNH